METNGNNNLTCGSEGELVAYLYAEATPAERERFESHLLACTACTDDFAEMSEARFSVFEWQKKEFAPMATPSIVIPYEKARAAGWSFGSLISFNWPTFAMASALLVAVAAIGFWSLGRGSNDVDQIAGKTKADVAVAEIAPPVDSQIAAELQPTDIVANEKPRVVTVGVDTAPAKAATAVRRPRTNIRTRGISPKFDGDEAVVTPQRANRRLPSLTADIDDDDKSLRLTDLFDKLDTRL